MSSRIERLSLSVHTRPPATDNDHTLHTLIVRLHAGETVGFGLMWAFSVHRVKAVAELVRELAPDFVGSTPAAAPASWQRSSGRLNAMGRGGTAMSALSVLDMAAWDLHARLAGLPMHHLLGTAREILPFYAGGLLHMLPDAELVTRAKARVGWGVKGLKISIGERNPLAEARRIALVREAIPPETEILIDAAGRLSREDAVAFARATEGLHIRWLEDMVDQADVTGFQEVAAATKVPQAGGQYEYGPQGIRRYADEFPVQVLVIDAVRAGGVTGWRRAAAYLELLGRPLTALALPHIHLPLLLSSPMACYFEYMDWWDDLLGPLHLKDGNVQPSSTPGWGCDLQMLGTELMG